MGKVEQAADTIGERGPFRRAARAGAGSERWVSWPPPSRKNR